MGKASRWFRGLLGLKKEASPSQSAASANPPKRRWSFVKSSREKDRPGATNAREYRRANSQRNVPPTAPDGNLNSSVDPSERAIAVATATAAVAEAAVAAAHAAAAVVRLTSSGRTAAFVTGAGFGIREDCAAVVIQSHFRGYLARRALRALKGLVKLQALVRGHIIRKHTADMLRRMQAILRAQARARVGRSQNSESPNSSSKSSHFHQHGPATPDIFEHTANSKSSKHDQPSMFKRNASKSIARVILDHDKSQNSWNYMHARVDNDEKTAKILEVDSGKSTQRRRNHHHSFHLASISGDQYSQSFSTSKDSTTHQTIQSPSSFEVQSLTPLKFRQDAAESAFCTANNSPQYYSASSKGGSSRRGPFTPIKSDISRSCLSGYSDHPNYMACTQSSKAKMRSLSAPKQRPQLETLGSGKRYSVHAYSDARSSSQRAPTLHESFANKAYPGSGRLDRLGMPVRGGDAGGLDVGYWNRY